MNNATFEDWIHRRMRLFAELPASDIEASRDRVRAGIHAGRSLVVLSEPVAWSHKRVEWVALLALLVVSVGLTFVLQRSWRAPAVQPNLPSVDSQRDSRPALPPLEVSVPVPTTVQLPSFEVAVIRPRETPRTYLRFQTSPDRLTSEGTSLAALIRYAYNVASFQVIGGPDWVHSQNVQFEVQAKAEKPVPNDQLRLMLQSLLLDRFKLKLGRQSKQTGGYLLQVERSGPKFKPAGVLGTEGCFPFPAKCTRTTMAGFVDYLSVVVFRVPVVDRTGLRGEFDLELDWKPDSSQFGGNGGVGFFAGSPNAPSIFTAIKDQLGLTLTPATVPIDIFTIENAEQPSEN
jgi:uncharacterized protein (TIGR03435 family)